jgi:hypothetical protein
MEAAEAKAALAEEIASAPPPRPEEESAEEKAARVAKRVDELDVQLAVLAHALKGPELALNLLQR